MYIAFDLYIHVYIYIFTEESLYPSMDWQLGS